MAILIPKMFQGENQDGHVQSPYQSIFEASETQKYILGARYEMADGRVFRYAKAGAVALVQARMMQSGVTPTAYYDDIAQTAYPRTVGDIDIRVLVATGSVAAAGIGAGENDFSGGWLVCNKTSPAVLGDIYGIVASKHYSETLLDLKLVTPWRNAMLATGEITLTVSKYFETTVFAAYDATAPAIGVPLCPVPINYYYWSQVKGPCPILVDGSEAPDIGQMIGCPITLATPGNCGQQIVTTAEVLRRPWGICMGVSEADEPTLVDLMLE